MKKSWSILVSVILMIIAVIPMNFAGVFAENITYGNELFAYAGMNGYFDATTADRNVSVNSFEKIMAPGWDAGAKLVKNTADSKDYLRLAKYDSAADKNFSSITTEMKIADVKTANFIKYTVKFRSRGTSAATSGLGLALGGGDKRVAQVELTGINSGALVESNGWITYVSQPIEVSQADLSPRTTLDMWFNTDGKTPAERYIEIDSISVGRSDTATGTYAENYPYSNFTAYRSAIANRERLTDQPITGGKLGSGDWDSYGIMMYDSENYFLRLAKTTDKDFSGFFSFVNWKAEGKGNYKVTMDLKATGATENIGFRAGGGGVNKEIRIVDTADNKYSSLPDSTALTGWKHFEAVIALTADEVSKADSVQMWNNTQGSAANYVDIDNISIKKVTDADAPVIEKDGVEYVKNGQEGDISVGVTLNGNEIENIKYGTFELESPLDYTLADNKITFTKSFLSSLSAGDNAIVINTKKGESKYQMSFGVYVVLPRPTIPDLSDLIEEETLIGGDFEGKALNSTLSKDVDANGWGSHNNDYPGKFVDLNGSRVMKIGKTDASDKGWASCFVMTNPIIQTDDTLKFEFDYKFEAADSSKYSIVNVSFVGAAANSDMFDIDLKNLPDKCNKGNGKYEWEVTGTDKGNGWKRVSMTFVADPTWSIKTNSIRFLMKMPETPVENDGLFIDNVSLIRYKSASETNDAPVFNKTAFTFNKADQKDVVVSVDLKDFNINKIEIGTVQIPATAFSYTEGANAVLTIKKEYLATLKAGEHTFSVTTLGGTATFKVTVSDAAPAKDGLPIGAIVGICVGGAVVLCGAGFAIYWFIIRKKK